MKKNISMILVLALCIIGLSACVQITAPAPQQQTPVAQTQAVQQTVAPTQTQEIQQTVAPTQTQVPPLTLPPTQAPLQVQPAQPVQPAQGGYVMPQFAITIDQAKQIALNAVGMSAENVVFTKQKQDYDDGMPEYEVEFVVNNMKYEFEISGINGAIIKQEIESVFS